jgi:Recombinase
MMAKTNAQRQAKWREHMHEAGFKPLTVWVSHEALEVLRQYPPKERGTVISQAVIEWKGNVTNNVSGNVADNIQPVLEELKHRLEVLERRVMGERTEKIPKSVTGDVTNNVSDNLTGLRSLAGTPEYRAALVKEAQRLHTQGLSYEQIAKRWTEAGKPTLKGGRWHKGTIAKMVQRYGGQ